MANTPLNFLLAYTSFTSLISNPQNNNIIPPRSVQLVARKNTPKNHRTSFRTEVEFPRSVQLVARNRQSRTEVEFPRSVQLVARIKTLIREIIRASRCTLQYGITLFDGARFLTRAFYINRLSAHAVKRAPSKAK